MPKKKRWLVVLVIGRGGCEHALCYALQRSPSCDDVFCVLGNAGTASSGNATCIADLDVYDGAAVVSFCWKWGMGLVVVGKPHLLQVFLMLGKVLRISQSIRVTNPSAVKHYIQEQGAPIVIKADQLAAGKGVTVAMKTI